MKIYVKASKQYDIENTPYSIVDYSSHADVVYTDSLQLLQSFSNYGQAYRWITQQNQSSAKIDSKDKTSAEKQGKQEKVKDCVYVIYAKGTQEGTRALYKKHEGPAKYCNGADAERFTHDELPRYTKETKKYEWIAKEVPY